MEQVSLVTSWLVRLSVYISSRFIVNKDSNTHSASSVARDSPREIERNSRAYFKALN